MLIPRVVYGSREGQEIESVPLDERLGLPAGDFSYVLEDWVQRFCLKGSFAEAAESLETLLGLRLGSRTLEHMSQDWPASWPRSGRRSSRRPPPRKGRSWSSPPTARGCRCAARPQDEPRPHHRRTKGEKANKKQMACVGAVYSIEPFVRTADDILDEVLRNEAPRTGPSRRTSTSGPR